MKKILIASLLALAFWSCENESVANSSGIKNISKPNFAESAPTGGGGEKKTTVVVVTVPKGGVVEDKIIVIVNKTENTLTLVDYSNREAQFFSLAPGSSMDVLSFESNLNYQFDERTQTYYLYE